MKKVPYLIVALAIISCGGVAKVFKSGEVASKNYFESIPFNYDHKIALIDVKIQGETYEFLVDTGAPTCISNKIYEKLNIEPAKTINVADAYGKTNKRQLVLVPEIKIGDLIYNNIGAVVTDLRDVFEFDCMKIDGIIGANQMSKSFWKFDYQNKNIIVTDQDFKFDIQSYPDSLKFFYFAQKTPYILGKANGKVTRFTYDTGFRGNIDIQGTTEDFKDLEGFTEYGSSKIGVYGAQDSVATRTMKIDSLEIGKTFVGAQTVDIAYASLIGNDFMNKHEVVIDWKNNYIYLKKNEDYEKTEISSFGFGSRFIDNKLMVVSVIKEISTDLKRGDQILRVNEQDFSNLNDELSCDLLNNFKWKELQTASITYMRDSTQFNTTLKKVVLIK